MSKNPNYTIQKALQQVTLWVHTEGRVVGSLFLSLQTKNSLDAEAPSTVLNEATPFLALQRSDPKELRFYNKKAIIRVEYQEEGAPPEEGMTTLPCHIALMDGSHIEGVVRCILPPGHARLYDYLNLMCESFAKLHLPDGRVCLVNKAYVMCVSPLTAQARAASRCQSDVRERDETSVSIE